MFDGLGFRFMHAFLADKAEWGHIQLRLRLFRLSISLDTPKKMHIELTQKMR